MFAKNIKEVRAMIQDHSPLSVREKNGLQQLEIKSLTTAHCHKKE